MRRGLRNVDSLFFTTVCPSVLISRGDSRAARGFNQTFKLNQEFTHETPDAPTRPLHRRGGHGCSPLPLTLLCSTKSRSRTIQMSYAPQPPPSRNGHTPYPAQIGESVLGHGSTFHGSSVLGSAGGGGAGEGDRFLSQARGIELTQEDKQVR